MESPSCAACARPLPPAAKRCSGCLTRPSYCDSACQRSHWATHRPSCKREAARLAAFVSTRAAPSLEACLIAAQHPVGELSAVPPPTPLSDIVTRVSSGVLRLADLGARGRGLLTTRPVKRLETLLVEEATAWLPAHLGDELGGAMIAGLLEFVPQPQPEEGVADNDDGGLRERLRSLLRLEPFRLGEPVGPLQAHSLGVVNAGTPLVAALAPLARRNALGLCFDDNLPAGERDLMVLSPATLMANHACLPSAVASGYWNGRAPAVRLIAENDMAEGEEVTIAYVSRSSPRVTRRATLLRQHGFVCECARCGPADSVVDVESERLQEWLQESLSQLGGSLWRLRPVERCARVEAVSASRAAVERGPLALWEVTLLAGHVNALAGRAEAAKIAYTEACALTVALFGAGSHRAKFIADFAAERSAATDGEVIAFETARAQPSFARWSGLPDSVFVRWRRPVRAEAEPGGRSVSDLVAALAALGKRVQEDDVACLHA